MKRPASLVVGILLVLMAIGQLCRIILGVEIVAAGMEIPFWPSALAAAVLICLAIWLFKERKKG
jgi:CBS-domain-containing membrane protein